MGGGREGVRESNERGWTDHSKEYSQQGYMKKPFEHWLKNRAAKQVLVGGGGWTKEIKVREVVVELQILMK
jgi:hypothetical protein